MNEDARRSMHSFKVFRIQNRRETNRPERRPFLRRSSEPRMTICIRNLFAALLNLDYPRKLEDTKLKSRYYVGPHPHPRIPDTSPSNDHFDNFCCPVRLN